jgi:hypothetical protein
MNSRSFWLHPLIRNTIGLLVLVLAWYLRDRFFFTERTGFQKFLPYLLLATMYMWIVFHNRILLDRLYLAGKTKKYFLWTTIIMVISSVNMYITIYLLFDKRDPLTQILGFWVFTIAGAGIYLLFRNRSGMKTRPIIIHNNDISNPITHFNFTADNHQYSLPLDTILYIESLENYIRLITDAKPLIVRMSLKDAEQKLSPVFIRISRSHLVNRRHIGSHKDDIILVGERELKIGKVYKKYVSELIASQITSNG